MPTELLIVPVTEIHTCLDEIIGILKKLKVADPANFHQVIVKQDIVIVTIETNLWQGDLETEVDGTKGDVRRRRRRAMRRCQSGRRVELLIL